MSLNSQDYADLAKDSYEPRSVAENHGQKVSIGGHEYRILDHRDNPSTGYQGTIYQRVDTNEIVVAHRGTEFDREPLRDGMADAAMVFNRTNAQVPDAIALTQKAIKFAELQGRSEGSAPPVTVTGHSLGGTLAQVTAHHFDLKGETFNAYGANSLGLRIPEGGDSVTNHVMAGDMVSAASGHYGQVKVYAEPQEIDALAAKGFDNSTHWSDSLRSYSALNIVTGTTPPNTLGAAIALADSHKMHHFVNVDGAGQPDRSVLNDPAAIERARTNATAINEYRGNVRSERSVLTAVSRNPVETMIDGVNAIRGPLPPGEPARRQEQEGKNLSRTQAGVGSEGGRGMLSLTSQNLLESSVRQVRQVAEQHGLPWSKGLENTAYAIAASAREQGMSGINLFRVADGQIRYGQLDGAMLKDGVLDARQVANQPMAESLQRLAQLDLPQQQGQTLDCRRDSQAIEQQQEHQAFAPEPMARAM